jgi:hypothetical protein
MSSSITELEHCRIKGDVLEFVFQTVLHWYSSHSQVHRYLQQGFGVESLKRNHYLTGYAYRSTFAELAVPLLFR